MNDRRIQRGNNMENSRSRMGWARHMKRGKNVEKIQDKETRKLHKTRKVTDKIGRLHAERPELGRERRTVEGKRPAREKCGGKLHK